MAFLEQIDSVVGQRVGEWRNSEELNQVRKIYLRATSDSANVRQDGFRFSDRVRRLFFTGLLTLIFSGAVSLVGVVVENDTISLVGAFLLVLAASILLTWLTSADDERKSKLGR